MEVVNALGRRKRAIARVFVSEGTGKITTSIISYLYELISIIFGL